MIIRKSVLAFILVIISASLHADALAEVDAEYHKTIILFKILQFVSFAEVDDNTLDLVCFGEDKMTRSIVSLSNSYLVSGKKIRVKHVENMKGLREITPIQILFIAGKEIDKLAEIQLEARKRSFLVISDGDGFAARGVHINLILHKGRIQFEINRTEVEKTGLYLSSKLYKLARIIE